MNKHSQYNADRLETARRAKDRARRLAWVVGLAAAVLSLILAVALVDDWWLLPVAARVAGVGLMGLLVAFGLFRLIQFMRHPTSAKQVALDLEAQRPELGCVVSTAAEYLIGERTASKDYEPELVDALQEQAAKRLLLVETNFYKKVSLAGGALAVAVMALLLFVLLASSSITALERVTDPWLGKTYTHLEVKPGDVEIASGHDQAIQTVFTGRPPKDAKLHWREASGAKWQTVAMIRETNGAYDSLLRKVSGPIKYQVTGSDAVSPEYTVQTYLPPEIKDFKIQVRYPDYTKLKPAEQADPNFSVVRASQLAFRITSSDKVAKARLRFASQPELDLTPDSGNVWTANVKATNDLYYWVELADAAGHKGGNETPFHIKVLPDEPPKVEIVDPGMDIRSEATNQVALKISATDDFGVEDVKLVFRKLNGAEQTVLCAKKNLNDKEALADARIDLTPLHLKEYELVAYHAEARDNNTLDGPGLGKSPVYFIEYTTKGEVLSQCNGSGSCQKINLLMLEKQIIAATTAIDDKLASEKFPEVATIQRQTKAYAEIFKDSFILSISPPEARTEFAAAIDSMEQAAKHLDDLERPAALKAEDDALEHLYQVTRLLPELEAGMCHGQGNCIKIVLEAIEKLKDSQKKKRDQELPKIIAQAKRIAARQAELADIYRRSQKENQPGDESTNKSSSLSPGNKSAGGKPGQAAGQNLAEADGQDGSTNSGSAGSLEQEQQRLSDEAAALAEKLRELSGKDPRVGLGLSHNMRDVARHLAHAANGIARRSPSSALQASGFGLSGLSGVITEMELLLDDNPRATDMATEEYPKEFEPLISEYLRRLSYAQ
jgi:Domain of unknown function (DUF4175)